jgi:hypothetical protein
MALASNTWYAITIADFTDPAWSAWYYPLPPAVVDCIASGVALPIFCEVDFGVGSYVIAHFLGGTCFIPSDAVAVVTTPVMDTSAFSSGDTWYSVRYPAGGAWLWHSSATFLVRRLGSPATLGAFIA